MAEQECGCKIDQGTLVPWTGPSITYCPMHKAAFMMLAALEQVRGDLMLDRDIEAVSAAIDQARGRKHVLTR